MVSSVISPLTWPLYQMYRYRYSARAYSMINLSYGKNVCHESLNEILGPRRCCLFLMTMSIHIWLVEGWQVDRRQRRNWKRYTMLVYSFQNHVQVKKAKFQAWQKEILADRKPNSWTYNFVEVSGHNLESSQTLGFRIQCLHYKPVSNHFCSKGGWGIIR